jgi:hypothetical protein
MKFQSIIRISALASVLLILFSCNEKETFNTESLTDYIIPTPGKYITYRLDSTVFTNFGRTTEIHKYQVKYAVDAQVTDNLGQTSYRVFRYIRDTAGLQPWLPMPGNYFITPFSDRIEVIEDNLRVIKLHAPIRNNYTWKGNTYLATDPYGQQYNFSNDDNMAAWDFKYDGGLSSFSYLGRNYADVQSVEEDDESFNVPITDPTAYAAKSRSVDKYSKTIGLVYREYEMWEYQPNPGGVGGPYKTGFGIKMWMIDHN